MISLDLASAIGRDAAQALGFLCVAGILAALVRWPHAARRDFLLAFIVFLIGTLIAQVPVHLGGMVGWGAELVLLSAVGRIVQDIGAALFVVASLHGHCPPWGWKSVIALVAFLTWWLP